MKLSVDRLSFTAGSKYDDLIRSLVIFNKGDLFQNFNGGYRYTGVVREGKNKKGSPSMIIQWGGGNKMIDGRYRIEYNPNRRGNKINEFLEHIPAFSKDDDTFRVTRIDWAVDIAENFNELEINYLAGGKMNYHLGRDKQIETIYCGSPKSDTYKRIYDKAREQKVDRAWTRAETQMRGNWTLEELNKINFRDIFDDIEIGYKTFNGVMGEVVYRKGKMGEDIFEKDIPLEYRALMLYLEIYPHYAGKLGRVKKEKLQKYRNMVKEYLPLNEYVNKNIDMYLQRIKQEIKGIMWYDQNYKQVKKI